MDQIKVIKKQAETTFDENFDLEQEYDNAELVEIQAQDLKKALQKIDSNERAMLLMKYQDDFSIKEIADTLNITESAVKMRLMRTKEKLRKIYTENIVFFSIIIAKALWFWKK